MESPRVVPSPKSMIVEDKSKKIDRFREPSTPQKRESRQPRVETPTKRRRVCTNL